MTEPAKNREAAKGSGLDSGRCGDQLLRFMLAGDTVRGAFLSGTTTIKKMRQSHGLGLLETLVLGHGLLAAGLMSTGLKGRDYLTIQVECSGPVKGIVVEADARGQVRGYLKNVPIPVEKPLESFDLRPFFGAGFITVTRHIQGARHPFQGRVMMAYGSLAKDLAHYYLTSEQVPTAFNLSVKFDGEGEVEGAAGLLLQAMPGADEETIQRLETMVVEMPSPGKAVASGQEPDAIIEQVFKSLEPTILSRGKIDFSCPCNKERVEGMLAMLGADTLKDMATNGPFPLVVRCHFCNTAYSFSKQQLQKLAKIHFSDN